MITAFRVLIDEVPDALDLEPDVDGVEWREEDPDLHVGSVHLYVHERSTRLTEVRLAEPMALEVRVLTGASSDDWALAFAVLERLLVVADTVFVEPDWAGAMTLDELVATCDDTWVDDQIASAARSLCTISKARGVIRAPGPVRDTIIGERVRAEIDASAAPGQALVDIMRRVQWIDGPHFDAHAVQVHEPDGTSHTITVVGPDLRYVLPPVDRVLLEHGQELIVPASSLDALPGVRVLWLDDGQRLMDAVTERDWPALVAAAEEHRVQVDAAR